MSKCEPRRLIYAAPEAAAVLPPLEVSLLNSFVESSFVAELDDSNEKKLRIAKSRSPNDKYSLSGIELGAARRRPHADGAGGPETNLTNNCKSITGSREGYQLRTALGVYSIPIKPIELLFDSSDEVHSGKTDLRVTGELHAAVCESSGVPLPLHDFRTILLHSTPSSIKYSIPIEEAGNAPVYSSQVASVHWLR
ncbi:hypothetical protein EVAR_33284_1 [Eumeta japonica]|uniref:Uncharacterized protein n=1 Tax=Eumeta variegata TaxID=151549 RepID=A0A4C1WET9_EUMVA|nr:hypothetical protein EVAR_33284_1 [Eumeta japonica]